MVVDKKPFADIMLKKMKCLNVRDWIFAPKTLPILISNIDSYMLVTCWLHIYRAIYKGFSMICYQKFI